MDLPEWSNGIGKDLVKVEDGKSVVGAFRGPLVRFYQHWPKGGRSSICTLNEPGGCERCQDPNPDVKKATGKFRINFVMKADPSDKNSPLVARIFEGGRKIYEQVQQINGDIPIEKVWVRLSKNKNYSLQVLPGEAGMISKQAEATIAKVQLHDLALKQAEDEEDGESGVPAAAAVGADEPPA